MGEVPRAYTQAFSFEDLMEDYIESDDEVEALRKGLVAVKFSKELKHEMRSPWTRALIVKVYGRSVGFNFIHNKLLSMWKPAGRLDCVGLGHGFFLTRLTLKEDYENILKKGPWFIGGHFLSIRPWEPNFHPATANVSSVAVWIRLNELPIEYYNEKALHQIGNSIGNVLRVDTHTATETKGKFARLCVQIDVNKPLITAILIGKFEQPVCYEGIQTICFGCGRVGHQKNHCPYTIRPKVSVERTETTPEGSVPSSPCKEHVPDKAKKGQGSKESVNESEIEESSEGTYGPWIVVARKRNGTRNQAAGRSPMEQLREQSWRGPMTSGSGMTKDVGSFQPNLNAGKDGKRKTTASKDINGPALANSLQRVGKTTNSWAKKGAVVSPDSIGVENNVDRTGLGKEMQTLKPKQSDSLLSVSVKGKKTLARGKALQVNSSGTNRAAKGKIFSLNQYTQGSSTQRCDGGQGSRASSDFQFTATSCSEMAVQVEGNDYRAESEMKKGQMGMDVSSTELTRTESMGNELVGELNRRGDVEDTELQDPFGFQNYGSNGQSSDGNTKDGVVDNAFGGDAKGAEAERMDHEGGGEVGADR